MPWPKLELEATRDGEEVLLTVSGELDLATGPSLERAISTLLQEPTGQLVLDLHRLTFCDSSGIASLIRIQRAVSAAGGTLRVRRVDSRVHQVLDIGGVAELLGVSDAPAT